MPTITIRVCEIDERRGQFTAHLEGRLLCTSRQPFLDDARVLLGEGADPDATLVMMRGETVSLRGRLGRAAGLVVEDNQLGKPVFHRFRRGEQGDGIAPSIEFDANSVSGAV